MLTAIRTSDSQKVIGNYIEKDHRSTYICEYCKKNVVHHKSEAAIKTGHFKHRTGESHCPNQTAETEYHLKTKLDIYSYIKNGWGNKLELIELEKWICNNSIRPDVYIETKKSKIAIEVQATILTVSEIKRRTEKYFDNGIYVLWILPYEFKRLYYVRYIRSHDDEYEPEVSYHDKVKLKEMEVFLYWAYFKKLFFWDLDHKYSEAFICVGLTEHKSSDTEFRRDGEDHYYYGKTAKTLKSVDWIRENIKFDQMSTSYGPEYEPPFRQYTIPSRKLFTFDKRR
ncbi:MAG: competence protein CoiA family protein [Saprospiraceae bacterium]